MAATYSEPALGFAARSTRAVLFHVRGKITSLVHIPATCKYSMGPHAILVKKPHLAVLDCAVQTSHGTDLFR